MKIKLLFGILFILILSACSLDVIAKPGVDEPVSEEPAQNMPGEAEARSAALAFYSALNQGAFDQAVRYYGGSYEGLEGYNPLIDPGDQAGLLKAGCEASGIMCLDVLEITLVQENEPGEYIYEVSFANPDGSLFILGPCCGATEEEMPPISAFTVHVVCDPDGICRVLDLPPYVP